MPEAPAENQFVPSPIRGLNVDVPVHRLKSGECSDLLNVNLINHPGALGLRDHFGSASSAVTSSHTGKIQSYVEWVDAAGNYRIAWKALGKANIYAWKPSGDTLTTLGACSTTAWGSLFVFGTDLYYVDESNLWCYLFNENDVGTLYNNVWGIGAFTGSPTITASKTPQGALDPGSYRWCVVPYDSKRDIEGRRSPFTEPLWIPPAPVNEGDLEPERPAWVPDPTQVTGYRALEQLDDPVGPPYHTGGAKISWVGLTYSGRFDKWRIYRTAPNTDFASRGAGNNSSFSQSAVLVGQVNKSAVEFDDTGGSFDANWDHDRLLQAAEEPPKSRLALQYGSSLFFFSTADMPGAYERSVPGKMTQVARHFTITEGGASRLRAPQIPTGGGICPVPATHTAVIQSQGQTILFTRTGVYRFNGSDRTPYIEIIDQSHGTGGQWQAAATDYGLIFYDGASLYMLAGGRVQPFPVMAGVDSILTGVADAQTTNVSVGYCSRNKELLVSYKSGTTQFLLSYDFDAQLWSKYRVNFDVYGMFEINVPDGGKKLYALTGSGLKVYPSASGETMADSGGSYATIVYGTEDLSAMKFLEHVRATVGDKRLKLTWTAYFSSADGTHTTTETITMGASEISNSFLLNAVSNRQFAGRYFTVKIEPVTASDDWSFIGFDLFKVDAVPVNP